MSDSSGVVSSMPNFSANISVVPLTDTRAPCQYYVSVLCILMQAVGKKSDKVDNNICSSLTDGTLHPLVRLIPKSRDARAINHFEVPCQETVCDV